MTPYTKIEDFAAILSDSLSRFQPFCHTVFNPDNILNRLPQNIHGSSTYKTLHKLLNSVIEPARELMVRVEEFLAHETSMDHKSTTLEFLDEKFLCELERLSLAIALTVGLLMKLDRTDQADMTPIVMYLISLTKI